MNLGPIGFAILVLAALVTLMPLSKPTPPPRYKGTVCILMFSTPNILDQYAQVAADINEAYARRHGYAFEHIVGPNQHRIPQWEKVRLVRETLPKYDAVFWIDSDAAFNFHHISLDEWLHDDADFIACTDVPNGPYHINCGTMLIKRSPWTARFLNTWWAMNTLPKYNKWANEQEALHDLIQGNVLGCRHRIRIEAADVFNSKHSDLMKGKRDTFVLHFMAMKPDIRQRELSLIAQRLGV